MPECRKWHFRASRFQNLPGEHSPEIPPRVRVRGLSAPEVFQLSTLMGSATYFRTYWNPWTLLGILIQNQITLILSGVQEMCSNKMSTKYTVCSYSKNTAHIVLLMPFIGFHFLLIVFNVDSPVLFQWQPLWCCLWQSVPKGCCYLSV